MKKIVALLLAMCMLLSLGACGKAAQSTASEEPETEEASTSQQIPTEALRPLLPKRRARPQHPQKNPWWNR